MDIRALLEQHKGKVLTKELIDEIVRYAHRTEELEREFNAHLGDGNVYG